MDMKVFAKQRDSWARILAFAYVQSAPNVPSDVLKKLRQDPKQTIQNLANHQYNSDDITAQAALQIQQQADQSPGETYSGYLPIPDAPAGFANLDQKTLAGLLLNGITGILQFDNQADIWADVLHSAWNDPTLLKNIRQDPLTYLPHLQDLQPGEYGIFPLPNPLSGLQGLIIDDLQDFFDDQNNGLHLGGIFLLGS